MKRTKSIYMMKVTALAGALLLAMSPVNGQPAQLDASDDPRVAGELELETDGCRKQREKYRGNVVARGKTCLRIYTYDPTAEDDDARNYGVVWLQSNLNSSRGWCGSKVLSDIDLPNNIDVESRSPRTMEIKNRKSYETVLTAEAGGNGTGDATSVEQDQVLYPEKVRTKIIDNLNTFRLKWVGLEKDKLGFASGAEISWAAGSNPDDISFRLNYSLKRGDC
jgi:hypothetical protein